MGYKETDIVHETEKTAILKLKNSYVVYRKKVTHMESDSAYPLDADGLSLAKARANYLTN